MEQIQRPRQGQQEQAQQTPSQPSVQSNANAGAGKKACDFLSKADAGLPALDSCLPEDGH